MDPTERAPGAAAPALNEQIRLQIRLTRARMPRVVPIVFAAGLLVSLVGLVPAAAAAAHGRPSAALVVFAAATAAFGGWLLAWARWPRGERHRIVPCFARPLGPPGGATMAAFRRGRGLVRDHAALESLAVMAASRPLSAFGFADEHHGQVMRWHPAAEGVRAIEALRGAAAGAERLSAETRGDLAALADVLREAARQDVGFALVLRLGARDSLQAVQTREARSGSFW